MQTIEIPSLADRGSEVLLTGLFSDSDGPFGSRYGVVEPARLGQGRGQDVQ